MVSLVDFLIKVARSGYGDPNVEIKKSDDGGHLITIKDDNWEMNDTFYGGNPYAGQEVVYSEGKAVWAMQYRGWLEVSDLDSGLVYGFLKKALLASPQELPLRGPEEFNEGEWTYKTIVKGGTEEFSGEELIFLNGNEVYKGLFFGGMVDL